MDSDLFSRRVKGLTGTEPLELLRSAWSQDESKVVGRFAYHAATAAAKNPIQDLEQSAKGSVAMCEEDAIAKEPVSKRRKRSLEAFGRDQDCPRIQKLRWEWKGETEAAGKLKCRVAVQGSDIFGGMRAMIEAGMMQGPLPQYVVDAPSLGGTIRVVDGAIVRDKDVVGDDKKKR